MTRVATRVARVATQDATHAVARDRPVGWQDAFWAACTWGVLVVAYRNQLAVPLDWATRAASVFAEVVAARAESVVISAATSIKSILAHAEVH